MKAKKLTIAVFSLLIAGSSMAINAQTRRLKPRPVPIRGVVKQGLGGALIEFFRPKIAYAPTAPRRRNPPSQPRN